MDLWGLIILAVAAALYVWLVLVVDGIRRQLESLNEGLGRLHKTVERQHRELVAVARGEVQEAGETGMAGEAPAPESGGMTAGPL